MVRESLTELATGQATEIERLIRQDHRFQEARTRRSRNQT